MTKSRWRSIDAHFRDGAGRELHSVLPIKRAKNSFRTNNNRSEMWFPTMQNQTSLTLCWRSFSWWGREGIAICLAYKGSQIFLCDWLQPIGGVICQDARPKIVDPPLTLFLPWLYAQYAINQFGTFHHSHCFGGLSGVFIYFILDHYIVF
jgi:hypothetical protein